MKRKSEQEENKTQDQTGDIDNLLVRNYSGEMEIMNKGRDEKTEKVHAGEISAETAR